MNAEVLEIAKTAVRHYAETHPRPGAVSQRQAAAAHLHIITNGTRAVLSPIVPAGWAKVGNFGAKQ